MSYLCDRCKEVFHFNDEVVFLCGESIVEEEENGGSGDIDTILCKVCYEENN